MVRTRHSLDGSDGAAQVRPLNPNTLFGLSMSELRSACEARSLDSSGNKNSLVDRLQEFLLNDKGHSTSRRQRGARGFTPTSSDAAQSRPTSRQSSVASGRERSASRGPAPAATTSKESTAAAPTPKRKSPRVYRPLKPSAPVEIKHEVVEIESSSAAVGGLAPPRVATRCSNAPVSLPALDVDELAAEAVQSSSDSTDIEQMPTLTEHYSDVEMATTPPPPLIIGDATAINHTKSNTAAQDSDDEPLAPLSDQMAPPIIESVIELPKLAAASIEHSGPATSTVLPPTDPSTPMDTDEAADGSILFEEVGATVVPVACTSGDNGHEGAALGEANQTGASVVDDEPPPLVPLEMDIQPTLSTPPNAARKKTAPSPKSTSVSPPDTLGIGASRARRQRKPAPAIPGFEYGSEWTGEQRKALVVESRVSPKKQDKLTSKVPSNPPSTMSGDSSDDELLSNMHIKRVGDAMPVLRSPEPQHAAAAAPADVVSPRKHKASLLACNVALQKSPLKDKVVVHIEPEKSPVKEKQVVVHSEPAKKKDESQKDKKTSKNLPEPPAKPAVPNASEPQSEKIARKTSAPVEKSNEKKRRERSGESVKDKRSATSADVPPEKRPRALSKSSLSTPLQVNTNRTREGSIESISSAASSVGLVPISPALQHQSTSAQPSPSGAAAAKKKVVLKPKERANPNAFDQIFGSVNNFWRKKRAPPTTADIVMQRHSYPAPYRPRQPGDSNSEQNQAEEEVKLIEPKIEPVDAEAETDAAANKKKLATAMKSKSARHETILLDEDDSPSTASPAPTSAATPSQTSSSKRAQPPPPPPKSTPAVEQMDTSTALAGDASDDLEQLFSTAISVAGMLSSQSSAQTVSASKSAARTMAHMLDIVAEATDSPGGATEQIGEKSPRAATRDQDDEDEEVDDDDELDDDDDVESGETDSDSSDDDKRPDEQPQDGAQTQQPFAAPTLFHNLTAQQVANLLAVAENVKKRMESTTGEAGDDSAGSNEENGVQIAQVPGPPRLPPRNPESDSEPDEDPDLARSGSADQSLKEQQRERRRRCLATPYALEQAQKEGVRILQKYGLKVVGGELVVADSDDEETEEGDDGVPREKKGTEQRKYHEDLARAILSALREAREQEDKRNDDTESSAPAISTENESASINATSTEATSTEAASTSLPTNQQASLAVSDAAQASVGSERQNGPAAQPPPLDDSGGAQQDVEQVDEPDDMDNLIDLIAGGDDAPGDAAAGDEAEVIDVKPRRVIKPWDKRAFFNLRKKRTREPEQPLLPKDDFQIDFHNSDLFLKVIPSNRHSAEPETRDGFSLMWCGARANFGVTHGKVAYQVKVTEKLETSLPFDDPDEYNFRCGWSVGTQPRNYSLGEAGSTSYCYSMNAKKATQGRFLNYGEYLERDDVITCCLDLYLRRMDFYLNGEFLGVGFERLPVKSNSANAQVKCEPEQVDADYARAVADVIAETRDDNFIAWFPHFATKNCRFEVNFGQQQEGWPPLPPHYTYISSVPMPERVPGYVPQLGEGERHTVLMMIGLPAAGKTTWVREYLEEHSDENWFVLSQDVVLDMMRVDGQPRQAVHRGRWDMVMGLAAKAMCRLIQLGCRRRRNYIIDQTNTAVHARKRKLSGFREFFRACVVLVPDEREFERRKAKRERETGVVLPPEAWLELKGLYTLPDPRREPYVDNVVLAEPDDDRRLAVERVRRHNKEGKPWYSQQHGYKLGHGPPPPSRRGMGGGGGGGFGGRGRGRDRDDDEGERGGDRDRRNQRGRRGFNRRDSAGGGGEQSATAANATPLGQLQHCDRQQHQLQEKLQRDPVVINETAAMDATPQPQTVQSTVVNRSITTSWDQPGYLREGAERIPTDADPSPIENSHQ